MEWSVEPHAVSQQAGLFAVRVMHGPENVKHKTSAKPGDCSTALGKKNKQQVRGTACRTVCHQLLGKFSCISPAPTAAADEERVIWKIFGSSNSSCLSAEGMQ